MKWIARERPKNDRIVCRWLIRRFIEPAAKIAYVPADEVRPTAKVRGGHSFEFVYDALYSYCRQQVTAAAS